MAFVLDKENIKELILSGNIDDYPEGIIVPIDKPYRWTSADVIRKVKWCACRHFHKKNLKVGHAGTLDPLATGVLLVCIGKATKMAEELQKHEKEYIAGITFGATTPSYDLEKDIDQTYPTDGVSEAALRAALPGFLGEQEQVAPLFSAKSVDGVRAYELARKAWKRMQAQKAEPVEAEANAGAADSSASDGQAVGFDHSAVEMLSKQLINIMDIDLIRFCPDGIPADSLEQCDAGLHNSDGSVNLRNSRINVTDNRELHLPHADIRVACSKGTYIRALARDLGEAMGSGAHLDGLRRTRTGGFEVSKALTITQATDIFREEVSE